MYLTVESVRRFLNIPFTDDDELLMELIEGAESAIEHHIGQPISTFVSEDRELDPGLKTAIKTLVANLYSNREPVAYGQVYKVPYTMEYLLQPYKKYTKD